MILIVGFEAARARGWRVLTSFAYLDLKTVIIAASAGGVGIARAVSKKHRFKETQWAGYPTDPIACAVRVYFVRYTDSYRDYSDCEATDPESVQAERCKREYRADPLDCAGLFQARLHYHVRSLSEFVVIHLHSSNTIFRIYYKYFRHHSSKHCDRFDYIS